MQSEHNRVKSVIMDTVTLLCKSSLSYVSQLKIEGVIGVTVDGCIFLVHIDQQFGPNDVAEATSLQTENSQLSSIDVPIKSEPVEQTDNGCSLNKRKPASKQVSQPHLYNTNLPNVKMEPGIPQEGSSVSYDMNHINMMTGGAAPSYGGGTSYDNVISLDDYIEDEDQQYPDQDQDVFNNPQHYEGGEATSDSWSHNFHSRPPTRKARGSQRGTRRPRISRNVASDQGGEAMVITESYNICGYPGCFKRFKFRHDLLRHQTKKHGRKPAFTRNKQQAEDGDNFAGNEDGYYGDEGFELDDDGGNYDYE